ncbi:Asp-tRNA(Asn)/Glu-tRNA(Gln) amidotransferase subunit GatA [Candidatus Nitronereus thalassa]|uniref:Glutamyl-tRNA(Gln) amidotransferase subunit A n=1 Tax=Candidatus Nitronereus thalassa TaxID=3020898 RepID=A0ABU3KCG8_9BACT|nr:Asp-tRNA(Asn)/Glu-tRNA(Gln) amidotransferase subunit GatA [Candidatus Nitronereus thalassa]MDT7044003.1 Asp-tRNA(Asn)/Glu-tRNA(Gln) amidotransferase subunit GatA [Candidatus Nitronereus thalassa]
MSLFKLTLKELQDSFTRGDVSANEIARSYFLRLSVVESKVKAYVTVNDKEQILTQAQAIDDELKSWRKTMPLMAMPIAIKDNICTADLPTTCGSRILGQFQPPYDASVISKFREHRFFSIGKTNLDEFGMGSSTEHSAFGPSRNPWKLSHVPGGSSGGSAAAVAADECAAALGTDTGGSIRQPAACCGVVGFKPTYGRVSRYGLIAFASSLDQIGPITKDVYDAAMMLNVLAGQDPMDSTTADVPVSDFTRAFKKKDVKKLKFGIPKEFFAEGLDSEVEGAVRQAIEELEQLGGKIQDVSLPHTGVAVATYYIVATAEASSNLARYDGVKYGIRAKDSQELLEMYRKTRQEGFGPEVKRRVMLGTYALSSGYYDAYYAKAQAVRTLITQDFDRVFDEVDLLVTPVMPTPAFKLGEKIEDPLQMYLSDLYTISASLAGIPAISIPCGFSQQGLPIGLQLMGRPFEEETVLRAARAYELVTNWRKKRPAIR